jgi:multimeric flavodoxin WrbA
MKIVVIHGSMRRGNTHRLTGEITTRLEAYPDVQITEFSVANMNLPFCLSCHACFARGEEQCPHYSLLSELRSALIACDGLIISGTTYMWALNGSMKNLLDHFAYMFHRPALFGKKGLVITTSAGNGEKGVAKYLKAVLGQWGINGALILTENTKSRMLQGGGDTRSAKEVSAYDQTAKKFYSLIKSGNPIPPSLKTLAVHNAFRVSSLSEFAENERDIAFWNQPGFIDKSYPVKIGAFRTLIGNFIYNAAKSATSALGAVYKKNRK